VKKLQILLGESDGGDFARNNVKAAWDLHSGGKEWVYQKSRVPKVLRHGRMKKPKSWILAEEICLKKVMAKKKRGERSLNENPIVFQGIGDDRNVELEESVRITGA